MSNYEIKYILDKDVSEEINNKLIKILSICFPDQPVFQGQRFYKELPQYRWYCEIENEIVAHTALHEKVVKTDIGDIKIGGIAEVCVHPKYRGKGLVKKMLEKANKYSINQGYKFSVLYGEEKVYKSSGYVTIYNEVRYLDHVSGEWKVEEAKDAMVKKLSNLDWPEGLIDINGPTF